MSIIRKVKTRIRKETIPLVIKTIDKYFPKAGNVMESAPSYELSNTFSYADTVFKTASKPDGFTYHGYKLLPPHQEYLLRKGVSKIQYDKSESYIRFMLPEFKFKGEHIPYRGLYIPFVGVNGTMKIGDNIYAVNPVYTDYVISVVKNTVMIVSNRTKSAVKNLNKNIKVNGLKDPMIVDILWTDKIHSHLKNGNLQSIGNVTTPYAYFIFGRYGIKGAFDKYTNDDIPIIKYNDDTRWDDDYDIFSSTRIQPRELKVDIYNPNKLSIWVKKDAGILSRVFVFNILYMYDLAPELAEDFCVNYNYDPNEKIHIKTILQRILFKGTVTADRGLLELETLLNLIGELLDPMALNIINKKYPDIENYFDLIALILKEYTHWSQKSKSGEESLTDKYLEVDFYLLNELNIKFNKLMYTLKTKQDKNLLQVDTITNTLNKGISATVTLPDTVKGLAIQPLDTTHGNFDFTVNGHVENQHNGEGSRKASGKNKSGKITPITGEESLGDLNPHKKDPDYFKKLPFTANICYKSKKYIITDQQLDRLNYTKEKIKKV